MNKQILEQKQQPTNEDHQQKSIKLISDNFSFIVRKSFTNKELRETIIKNQTEEYKNSCATHDYCDANELMEQAFEISMKRGFEFTENDFYLINEAWERSRKNSFMDILNKS